MKQPTIEFNVETDTCPRCGGHSFERIEHGWLIKRWFWKCLSCKQVISEINLLA